jgi:hypothetical protein
MDPITLAFDPVLTVVVIALFSVIALIFGGGCVLALIGMHYYFLARRKKRHIELIIAERERMKNGQPKRV